MAGAINVHNDPVICCSVATAKGDTFRTSTIYTKDERHTADNEKMQKLLKMQRKPLAANTAQHQQKWNVEGFLVEHVKSSNTTQPPSFKKQKIQASVFPIFILRWIMTALIHQNQSIDKMMTS